MNQRDSTERRSLRSQECRQSLEIVKKKKEQGNGVFLPLEHLGGVQPCGHLAQWDSFQISDSQHCRRMFCFNPLCANVLQQQQETNTQVLCELLWWLSGNEPARQCRRHRFDPWVGKIPWGLKWLPTPEFLPGKSHGQSSLLGYSPWDGERVGHDFVN